MFADSSSSDSDVEFDDSTYSDDLSAIYQQSIYAQPLRDTDTYLRVPRDRFHSMPETAISAMQRGYQRYHRHSATSRTSAPQRVAPKTVQWPDHPATYQWDGM